MSASRLSCTALMSLALATMSCAAISSALWLTEMVMTGLSPSGAGLLVEVLVEGEHVGRLGGVLLRRRLLRRGEGVLELLQQLGDLLLARVPLDHQLAERGTAVALPVPGHVAELRVQLVGLLRELVLREVDPLTDPDDAIVIDVHDPGVVACHGVPPLFLPSGPEGPPSSC